MAKSASSHSLKSRLHCDTYDIMPKSFWGILVGVIALSLGFVAGAIYLIVRIDLGLGVDDQVNLVHDHVRARFRVFATGLAEEERLIEARLRATLPSIGMLAVHARTAHRDVSAEELRGWAQTYGLDDIRILAPDHLDKELVVVSAADMATPRDDAPNPLEGLLGSGRVLFDLMGISPQSGRLEAAAYHSPPGARFVVRGAIDVHDFGRLERSPAYRDYLFGEFFADTSRSHSFLSGIDIFVVNEKGSFSFIKDGRSLSARTLLAIEREPMVRTFDGDRLSVLSRLEAADSGLKGARFAVVETDFNFATMTELWKRISVLVAVVLLIAGAAAFLAFYGFFRRFLVRRMDAVLGALRAISAGDYRHAMVLPGTDEFAAISRAVDAMRERIRDRERELADARDTLEGRVAERTRDLEKEIETRKAYEQQLREMATRDPLTNIWNRRAFDERAHIEMTRAERYQRPLALMMVDIDHFKRVNDTHGHTVGDEVLQAVSAVLNGHGRAHDLVARVGGEEFAILMPETGIDSARVVAERIRAAVEQQHILTKGGDVRVTISAGVGAWSPDTATLSAFMAAADAALYQAKETGRNRVCLAA